MFLLNLTPEKVSILYSWANESISEEYSTVIYSVLGKREELEVLVVLEFFSFLKFFQKQDKNRIIRE